jgi:acyl-CoA synthetase (NDP forming)
MEAAYTGMLAAGFDLNCLILDYPRSDRCSAEAWKIPTQALYSACRTTGAKAAILSTLQENLSERRAAALIDQGIAPMLGIDETLNAIEAAAAIGEAWSQDEPAPVENAARPVTTQEYVPDEAQAKRMLSQYGIAIPRGKNVSLSENPDGVAAIVAEGEKMGFPLVLKALGIEHKSELNGLRLDLRDAQSIQRAAIELSKISKELYLEEMICDGVFELLVGLTFDAQFGLIMTVATGGTMVEILDDSQTLLLPASPKMVEKTLLQLKCRVFFDGFRGLPKADLIDTIEVIMAVQKFALANSDTLIELDINPLIIRPAGQGTVAADALIKLRRPQQ